MVGPRRVHYNVKTCTLASVNFLKEWRRTSIESPTICFQDTRKYPAMNAQAPYISIETIWRESRVFSEMHSRTHVVLLVVLVQYSDDLTPAASACRVREFGSNCGPDYVIDAILQLSPVTYRFDHPSPNFMIDKRHDCSHKTDLGYNISRTMCAQESKGANVDVWHVWSWIHKGQEYGGVMYVNLIGPLEGIC